MGEIGVSGIGDGGGGRDVGFVRSASDAGFLSLLGFFDSALRLAERRPDGSEDFVLEVSCEPLPEVDGRLPSCDARGRGPSFSFGFVYWA